MKSIYLMGPPNSGKSTLFNSLVGGPRARTGNFAGITVQSQSAHLKTSISDLLYPNNQENIFVYDLPGQYSLKAYSLEEKYALEEIVKASLDPLAHLFLVLDVTQLQGSLNLLFELKECGIAFGLILTHQDKMDQTLKAHVLEFLNDLDLRVHFHLKNSRHLDGKDLLDMIKDDPSLSLSQSLESEEQLRLKIKNLDLQKIQDHIQESSSFFNKLRGDQSWVYKLDHYLLTFPLSFVLPGILLIALFQLLFVSADPMVGLIEEYWQLLTQSLGTLIPGQEMRNFFEDGLMAGIGSFLVFLPHIGLLFIFISLLEESGYLARMAFILDRILRFFGLPGQAVVPLLSSHACAIPGIMSARIIANPFQRWLTMMIVPLTTCSARLPVYVLLIGALIPKGQFLSIEYKAWTLFCLYALGLLSALILSFFTSKIYPHQSSKGLAIELVAFKRPSLRVALKMGLEKMWGFIKSAGPVIALLSMILWALVSFPKEKPFEERYAARIGKMFTPLFTPQGFDWKLTTALIPSFAAREVMVGALATTLSVEQSEQDEHKNLRHLIAQHYSLAQVLALLVWFVFSPQCISTLGILKKETKGIKGPSIYFIYSLTLAWLMSALVGIWLS